MQTRADVEREAQTLKDLLTKAQWKVSASAVLGCWGSGVPSTYPLIHGLSGWSISELEAHQAIDNAPESAIEPFADDQLEWLTENPEL